MRIRGGGTRSGWGHVTPAPDLVLLTAGLDSVVEHNEGDLTAVLQAGVPLRAAQERFAAAGQMLALDPPGAPEATIGGVFATGDSGPLRHRYGAARDLIVGITVALPDGSVAKAGGKVIKNVAGYDLSKLFTGAFGTLGLIAQVAVRLHPRPPQALTARGIGDDADRLAAAASALAHRPLEAECLDVAWSDGRGAVLARFGGATAQRGAETSATVLREHGLRGRRGRGRRRPVAAPARAPALDRRPPSSRSRACPRISRRRCAPPTRSAARSSAAPLWACGGSRCPAAPRQCRRCARP